MNRAQRVVLIVYCLLIVYCCVWIPWHAHVSTTAEHWYAGGSIRLGYGWVWAAPGLYAVPDAGVILLRVIAASGLGAAAFLIAGLKPTTRN
jgi:hypothetical protein